MISVPQVMISSTFFDLKQVRADLIRAVEELGCRPLSSELPSFPIDPDADTIENCRRRVERDADILVLIVGGRYGFVDSQSARSVTNIEYLVARAKGIPIYTFVERRISALLPIWKANREGDFASVVDDRRVFEFIEEVREQHKVWMREFEVAEEIVTALRWEFAHLALQGARLVKRAFNEREIEVLSQLKGVPLRIALEKPNGWKPSLLAEILIQEIESMKELAAQHRLGIAYGTFQYIDKDNLNHWLQSRVAELQFLMLALGKLINEEVAHAWSKKPDDLELLVRTAYSLAALYREALEWSLRVRRSAGGDAVASLANSMEHLADDVIRQLKEFGFEIRQKVKEREEAILRGESGFTTLSLDLAVPKTDEILELLGKLIRSLVKKTD